MEASDAVDLASTYNRLGLALRDSGKDYFATKEAFLAGLSEAPQDLTLLVNGGVAHQVRRYIDSLPPQRLLCFALSFWLDCVSDVCTMREFFCSLVSSGRARCIRIILLRFNPIPMCIRFGEGSVVALPIGVDTGRRSVPPRTSVSSSATELRIRYIQLHSVIIVSN